MDYLFLNHSASVEAMLVFLSLGIIFLFLLSDFIIWAKQKYYEFHPNRNIPVKELTIPTVAENISVDVASPKNEILQSDSTNTQEIVSPMLGDETIIAPTESAPEVIHEISLENVTGDALEEKEIQSPTLIVAPESSQNDSENLVKEETISSENEESGNLVLENTIPTILDSETSTQKIEPIQNNENEVIDEVGAPDLQERLPEDIVEDNTIPILEEKIEPLALAQEENNFLPQENENPTEESKLQIGGDEIAAKKSEKKKQLSPSKREKIVEIVNNVKTLIARGHLDDARALIVNGLSLEKTNRELNLLMASLYERDHAFEKAEFILKELAEQDSEDIEVLNHLATVLAMQRKFEVSYELYKKILSLTQETEEILYTLAHIATELGITEECYQYAKSYLKQFPKNPEILWLYSQAQISKGERKGAIETLIKLKNLTPYNQEIVDLISKLVTEDELAGNFGEEAQR